MLAIWSEIKSQAEVIKVACYSSYNRCQEAGVGVIIKAACNLGRCLKDKIADCLVNERCCLVVELLADTEDRSISAAVDESERWRWSRRRVVAGQGIDCRVIDSLRKIFVYNESHLLGKVKEAEGLIEHSWVCHIAWKLRLRMV